MPESRDDINLGNPCNSRRDAEERNDAKVTSADHPAGEIVGAARSRGDDVFDEVPPTSQPARARKPRERPPVAATNTADVPQRTTISEVRHVDVHSETVRDPEVEMTGELTSHVDPLSGETGMHPLGVGVGAAAGGAAAGTVAGLAVGAIAGPLGAAIGAAVGTTLGVLGGGYTGKRLAEKVNPTTEDHFWRHNFASRPYVPRGAKYEEWEPAYEYGIDMREWLLDKTWEESEPIIRTGWEQSEAGQKMPWEVARPAIQDAWDHLTPGEPNEPEVTGEERREA